MHKGFVQIPVLVAILFGLAAAGMAGYVGVSKYTQKQKSKEEKLEKRVEELETILTAGDVQGETATTADIIAEAENDVETPTPVPAPSPVPSPVPAPTPQIVVPQPPVEDEPEDFKATCKIADEGEDVVDEGDYVDFEVDIPFEPDSLYDIEWSKTPTFKTDEDEVRYKFNSPGDEIITAIVTRITDGYSKTIECPLVTVECVGYHCLSTEEKQVNSLKNILDTIDSWLDSSSPVNSCAIGESIIRGYEYEYSTVLGGEGIPVFNPYLDCSSEISISVYRAKIELLLSTF